MDKFRDFIENEDRTVTIVEFPYTFDLVRGDYDSSWYWKPTGSYDTSKYTKDEERSGGRFEAGGNYLKTWEEVEQFARLMRAKINLRKA